MKEKAKRDLYLAEDRIETTKKELNRLNHQINSLVIEDNGLDFRDKALAFYADNIQDQYTVVTRIKG